MDSIFEYFDPGADFERYDGNLPHWRQSNVLYFVTFRLGDSIPESKLNLWKTERALWLRINPEPHSPEQRKAYLRQFVDPIERWLDAGYGSCILKFPETKKIVEESLVFARGKKYALDEYVIMPNHVHVLVAPNEDVELEDVLKSWKSYTSHEINKLLGKRGQNWQKESFDHIVRSPEHLERLRQYIRDNPKKLRKGV